MKIVLNGAPREVANKITVADLLHEIDSSGGDGRGVAVAVDAEVVPRGEWDALELSEGQRVEVLSAIQGG